MKPPPLLLAVGIASILLLVTGFMQASQRKPTKAPNPHAAPELTGGPWINTKDGKPVAFESRKGKPTLVAFWTFACSNCQANLPVYARLLAKYRAKGVELVSVHTPELSIERDPEELKRHIARFKIDYPVLVDNDNANWNRWRLQYWPTLFVVDGEGTVIQRWEGELNWNGTNGEAQVAELLDRLLAQHPATE